MTLAIDITIESELWTALPEPQMLVERTIGAAARVAKAKVGKNAELSVLLCDDATIRALNKTWRGVDSATNVLSFSGSGPDAPVTSPLLGDIVVAFETAHGEADSENKTLADHTAHLIVHGFLHLLGYEHDSEAEAEEMEHMERQILTSLGISDPYEGTVPVTDHSP